VLSARKISTSKNGAALRAHATLHRNGIILEVELASIDTTSSLHALPTQDCVDIDPPTNNQKFSTLKQLISQLIVATV